MSFTVLCAGMYFICKPPAFLPIILTFISTVSMSLNNCLLGVFVNILSTRIAVKPSLNSSVIYTPLSPASIQFTAKFCINKLLPDPEPPANICSSPLLNPPYNSLSNLGQPVLFCPLLSFSAASLARGSSK